MRRAKVNSLLFLILIAFISLIPGAEMFAQTSEIPLDPLDPVAGAFLDVKVDSLETMADNYYQAKNYKEAARFYLEALHYNTANYRDIYNLACCYGLMGEVKLATEYIERAIRAGFTDFAHIRTDPDFDPVRGNPIFAARLDAILSQGEKLVSESGTPVYFEINSVQYGRLLLPENYSPEKKYNLIIGLHGAGGDPVDFMRSFKLVGGDFIFATLAGPYTNSVTPGPGYFWYNRLLTDSTLSNRMTDLAVDYIAKAVRDLKKKCPVDKVFLVGFSQGAMISYEAGIRKSDIINGIICFGGILYENRFAAKDFEAGKKLRVFIAHGFSDAAVPFADGEKARDLLRGDGYDVTFISFEGGHFVPASVLAEALKWVDK